MLLGIHILIIFVKKYKIFYIVNKFEVLKKNGKSLWLLKKQIQPNCVTDVMQKEKIYIGKKKIDKYQFFERLGRKKGFHFSFGALRESWGESGAE